MEQPASVTHPTSGHGGLPARTLRLISRIGFFRRFGAEYRGSIVTLSVQHMDVRIAPVDGVDPVFKAADHYRVIAGSAEMGRGWIAPASDAPTIMQVHLDDPSWLAPIVATLVPDADGVGFVLTWQRSSGAVAGSYA